jgi:hypothetical protein
VGGGAVAVVFGRLRVDVVAFGQEGPDTLSLFGTQATCSSSGRAIAFCLLVKSLVLSHNVDSLSPAEQEMTEVS